MAGPAAERETGVSLRVLPGADGYSVARSVPSGLFLRFAQKLSRVSSQSELRERAQEFLSDQLAPCNTQLVTSGPADRVVLRPENKRLSDATSPTISAVDGRCRVETPMNYQGTPRGRLLIDFEGDPVLSPEAVELIELVAFTCAGELTRLIDARTVDEHMSDLNFIRRLEQQVSIAKDVVSIGDLIRHELGTVIDCTFFALLTTHDDPATLEVVAHRGTQDAKGRIGRHIPIEGSRLGQVFRSGEPVLIDNILDDEGAFGREDAYWRSLMIAPLISGHQTFGVVMVGHELPSLFTERDLRIVELTATHIANAIYRLVEDDRERTQHLAAIETLSAAVDARDPFTHTHSRRVAELARLLALRLGLPEKQAEQIELAGLLHDIGKIGIPDRMLTKPGKLDAEERLVMMSHAEMGANIVGNNPALSELTPIVRHHHEWYDGRGYPDGLRGDEIPLPAAILSVADALETMTSNRVYRLAMKVPLARQELVNGRGSQFHPEIVDAMVDLIDNDPDVREILAEMTGHLNPDQVMSPIRISDVVDLRVMTRIASEIGTLTEIDSFLRRVHMIVREELELADVDIWLVDESTGEYVLAAGETNLPPPDQLEASTVHIGGGTHSEDAIVLSRDRSTGLADQTVIFPMYVEDSQVGLIELVLIQPGYVDGRDIDLLQAIAAPVASTVRVAQLHDEAKRAATIDGLTGVLNHRAFYGELDRHMLQLEEGETVCLLIVDVIGLKAINDNYGHLAGDKVLRHVARSLVHRLRGDDVVARYGGDEFVAILRGSLDTPLDEIIARIESPVPVRLDDGAELNVRLRCGSATSLDGDTWATELVARADTLLYGRHQPTARGDEGPVSPG
ncbi:hypothetical protein BH23CHL2_BH23CHL2_25300 [soil metagenome]